MVGTSSTADDLTQASPRFFRVAPTNRREAQVAAQFVDSSLRLTSVVLLQGRGDAYSESLANDFRTAWRARRRAIGYTGLYDTGDANAVAAEARQACGRNPDLIFFAGRAEDLVTLLRELDPTRCAKTRILAGDDTARVTEGLDARGVPLSGRGRLFYTAFAHVDAWERASRRLAGQRHPFFDEYAQTFPTTALDLGHSGLGYDATKMIGEAAVVAFQQQRSGAGSEEDPERLPERAALTAGLRGLSYQGVTGLIDFAAPAGPGAGYESSGKTVVILELDRAGRVKLVPGGVCGRFTLQLGAAGRCGWL
jgi:ABC-type branched-subunit amino acid transport system substrate-binding protein